jgi:hypothetical protein
MRPVRAAGVGWVGVVNPVFLCVSCALGVAFLCAPHGLCGLASRGRGIANKEGGASVIRGIGLPIVNC